MGGIKNQPSGITLTELMVAVALISLGILASLFTFSYISTSIQNSKFRTLSNNLAQEQIEKLKNLSYYSLLVTTSTYSDNRFNPPLAYDTGNYPAQTLIQGGIPFTRATRVDFAYQSGNTILLAPPTSNDTGLKQITVYVMWQNANGWHDQEMHNLMTNSAANALDATFKGTVQDNLGNNLSGALVQALENSNFSGQTNSLGAYNFNISSGSYTLQCSNQGYFTQTTNGYQTVAAGQTLTVNFTLTQMASGTAAGNVYLDNHLVISQVVASTQATVAGSVKEIEYIELYNPTLNPVNVGTTANNDHPNIVPIFWDSSNSGYIRHIIYISTYVASHGYYLFSNTKGSGNTCNSFTMGGTSVSPDACWQFVTAPNHAFECGNQPCSGSNNPDAGGISLGNSNAYASIGSSPNMSNWPAAKIDSVGWSKTSSGHAAPNNAVETNPVINVGVTQGLRVGESYTRMTDPGNVNASYGRTYDSDDNSHDFADYNPLTTTPNSSVITQTSLTGTPATGAYVTFNDPLSQMASCSDTYVTNATCLAAGSPGCRACSFATTGIATGTWTMAVSSGSYYTEVSSVTITSNTTTGVPNTTTIPAWLVAGDTWSLLNNTTNYAFISGVVTDANNTALQGITVSGGGNTTQTGSTGRYFIAAASGDVQVIANPGNQNRAYVSQSVLLPALNSGVLYDNPIGVSPSTWFQLSLAGILKGYFQTASNTPLPNRVAVALSGGNQAAQAVSDSTGYCYLTNLATGTYTLQPSLDPAEMSSPSSVTVTLASTGTATSVSTFTITSGLAQITGNAKASGQAITTGVLVMASTATLPGGSTAAPPALSGATGPSCSPCYYAASSDSAGQYTLNVRSSTTTAYQLYGWYTTFNGTSPSFTRQGPYAVNVSTPGQVAAQDIAW